MQDEPYLESLRMLYLEDERRDIDLLSQKLTHDGIPHLLQVVSTQDSFLEALQRDSFDLILSEVRLAGADGMEALRQARTYQPNLPFIFVTRVLDEPKEVEALTNGATDYLLKSRLNRLSFTIRRALWEAKEPNLRKIGREMEGLVELMESFESAHDPVILQDLDERILFWNTGAERLYGWQKSDVLGKRLTELFPDNLSVFLNAKQEVVQRGEWKNELNLASKLGRELVIDACWTLLRNKSGKPRAILAMHADISDRKRLESRSLRAQRMEAIGTLTGGIAHDLNNILSPVMLSTSLLRVSQPGTSEFEELLQTIDTHIQRGADLIKQLLVFCRGAEGKHSVIRLDQLLRKIGSLAQQTFPRNINVLMELSEELWAVNGDATQIDQVLLNLCLNARDAMPDGGYLSIRAENTRVEAHSTDPDLETKPGPYVRLVVTDTGCGIPKAIVDKIFEPFFTTKEVGKGTGLGLSMALGIIKAHHGYLRVRSTEDKGSTFEVYLPAVTEVAVGKARETTGEGPVGRGQVILLVDDEPAVLVVVQKILKLSGYNTLVARDGSEAISLFIQSRGTIELVISDIVMPSMDGVTLMGLIRKIDPGVRLIAASGFKEGLGADRLAQMGRLGISCLLDKPYTKDKLLSTLSKALQERDWGGYSADHREGDKLPG